MAKKDIEKDKVRIKIKAYDHKLIDNVCRQIIDAAKRYEADVVGPTPLPTEIKRYTVNRSTFVHKDSREQFELRVHKRLLEIMNPTAELIGPSGPLTNLNLPAGVDIEMKIV